MIEFLWQFDDDVELCVVTNAFNGDNLDIVSCDVIHYEEDKLFIAIRAEPVH